MKLTDKQHAALDALVHFEKIGKFHPTFVELANFLGWSITSTREKYAALRKKRLVIWVSGKKGTLELSCKWRERLLDD